RRALIPVPAAILAAAFGLAGCFGGGAPPPPGGGGGGGTPTGPAGPPVACQNAGDGETPLVTVESTPAGPEITSTPVSSQAEADAVVAEAAADGDLVAVEADLPRTADVSNDTLRPQQWALNNVAFESSWASANNGGTGQVVAVIDTGVYANHPDLAGQVLAGQYFLHSADGGTTFSGAGGTSDANGHGTHVAGIIGAVANNNAGITGAAPGVDILPVQVLCGDGSGFSSDVANGIIWATDNGADVINLSLGGSGASSAEQSAIQYARANGVVVVASAGNSGNSGNAPSYPGAFPEVIGVAALLNNNTRASYSTVGSYVDIAAPGGTGSNPSSGITSTWNNGGYVVISGTSMASPHVAAAAALVRAAHGFTTHADVCNQLIRTADDLGPPTEDDEYGHGRVDPLEAVGVVVPGVTPSCT
ncbi:MAG: S8 family serine peptidase, partial [Actinomycetota bacterium]